MALSLIPTLQFVASEFEEWRKIKNNKFSKMPPHLINLVNQLQNRHKKTHIIKALKLNTTTFKKITNPVRSNSGPPDKSDNINFIELPPVTNTAINFQCILQRPDGTQLKVNTLESQQLKDIIQLFLCYK